MDLWITLASLLADQEGVELEVKDEEVQMEQAEVLG